MLNCGGLELINKDEDGWHNYVGIGFGDVLKLFNFFISGKGGVLFL
jgi:hypothetical protein